MGWPDPVGTGQPPFQVSVQDTSLKSPISSRPAKHKNRRFCFLSKQVPRFTLTFVGDWNQNVWEGKTSKILESSALASTPQSQSAVLPSGLSMSPTTSFSLLSWDRASHLTALSPHGVGEINFTSTRISGSSVSPSKWSLGGVSIKQTEVYTSLLLPR